MIEKLISSSISGIVGGISSALISIILAAYVVPMPVDTAHHVVGYGIGGFMCGMLSGFMGVYTYMKRVEKGVAHHPQSQ